MVSGWCTLWFTVHSVHSRPLFLVHPNASSSAFSDIEFLLLSEICLLHQEPLSFSDCFFHSQAVLSFPKDGWHCLFLQAQSVLAPLFSVKQTLALLTFLFTLTLLYVTFSKEEGQNEGKKWKSKRKINKLYLRCG